MSSSKLNVLSHNSVLSCQIWKIPSQTRVIFLRQLFSVPTILCYLQNWTLHLIFLFISILFALRLHKLYFLLFNCKFDSLKWQFGTYSFMYTWRLLQRLNWYVFLLTIIGQFHFLCELCFYFFLNLFMFMPNICSWGTNYTFLLLLPSGVSITMSTKVRSSFGGSTLDPDPDPDPYLCCTFWGTTPSVAPLPSMSHLRSCRGSTLDLDPAPDPYLGCIFWPEFSLYWYYVNPVLSSKFNIVP